MAGSTDAVSELQGPAFRAIPRNSDLAFVAFSALGAKADVFHFSKLAAVFPDTTTLLISDPRSRWYNAGLPGMGDTVEEIAEWMREKLTELGARRAITVGASMGGYAAILFGCKIGAERAIAFTPQMLLDPRLPALSPPADTKLQVPDLTTPIKDTPDTAVELIAGRERLLDLFHVQRISRLPSTRVLVAPACGHLVAKELNDARQLWPTITELTRGEVPATCELTPPFDPETVDLLGKATFAWTGKQWQVAAEALAGVITRRPEWAAPRFAMAVALSHLADWPGVLTALRAAKGTKPKRLGPRIDRALALIEAEQLDEAGKALKSGF